VFPRAAAPKEEKVATKDQLNKKIPQINALIGKLDDGKAVFYKDISAKFLTEDGGLSREVMPDLLHLSAKGYEIWAEAIQEDIAKLVK
jgi:lysophospholipase L1-like esterase